MPIPSQYVTVFAPSEHEPRPTPSVVLAGGNGDAISLTGTTAGYDLQKERGLFGLPDPGLQLRDGAGDGTRWAGSRRSARTFDLNLRVYGDTAPQFRARLARLADILDDRHGIASLGVITPQGSREIDVLYTSGWGGDGSGFKWQDVAFTLTAPDPFFRASTAERVTWRAGGGKALLSPTVPFFPVQLASSQVLGDVTLNNPGDVEGPGTWTVTGPGGPITVAPSTTEPGFTIAATLASTDVLTADGDTKTLRDQTGANRYDLFGPAPKLWPIPPGQSTASVVVGSAASGTSVTLAWFPRYKLAA